MEEIRRIRSSENEFSRLHEIIKVHLNVDVVEDKSRDRDNVDARMIWANILFKKGYGCSALARYLRMNHATMLHYRRVFDNYQKSDLILRDKYITIANEFNEEFDPVFYLTNTELKKEVFSLRNEIKALTCERDELQDKCNQYEDTEERFDEIFKLIKERTMRGEEEYTLKKLNTFYNGVYGYRDR